MKSLWIYFNEERTSWQVVIPNPKFFKNDWRGLLDAVTGSDDFDKNYFDYEVK